MVPFSLIFSQRSLNQCLQAFIEISYGLIQLKNLSKCKQDCRIRQVSTDVSDWSKPNLTPAFFEIKIEGWNKPKKCSCFFSALRFRLYVLLNILEPDLLQKM